MPQAQTPPRPPSVHASLAPDHAVDPLNQACPGKDPDPRIRRCGPGSGLLFRPDTIPAAKAPTLAEPPQVQLCSPPRLLARKVGEDGAERYGVAAGASVWGQSKQPLRLQSVEAIARCDVLELACGGARIQMLSQVDGEWPAAAARASSRHAAALVQLLWSNGAALVVQPFGQGHRVSGEAKRRRLLRRASKARNTSRA